MNILDPQSGNTLLDFSFKHTPLTVVERVSSGSTTTVPLSELQKGDTIELAITYDHKSDIFDVSRIYIRTP